MKKIKLIFGLLIFALLISITTLNAQPPPPPPNEDSGDTPIGGDAPAGSGLLLIVGFTAAYAGKKIYNGRKKEDELD